MAVSKVAPTENALKKFYDILKEKLFDCTSQIFGCMANFHREIEKDLSEMDILRKQIAEEDRDLVMKLSDFVKDVRKIRDYYNRIITSTETIINYGSKQNLIPYIITLIDKNSYTEATQEISSFLDGLKRLIEGVEKDIYAMNEDAEPNEVQKKITVSISECANRLDDLKNDMEKDKAQAVCDKVFRLGSTTLVYVFAGAVATGCVISCIPKHWSAVTETVQSAGSEVLSFVTDNVLKGLGSVVNAANLSKELKKTTESKLKEISNCLLNFFLQINEFQSNIKSIIIATKGLKEDISTEYKAIRDDTTVTRSTMELQKEILEKMFNCIKTDLPSCIAKSKDDNEGLDDVLSVSSMLMDNHS